MNSATEKNLRLRDLIYAALHAQAGAPARVVNPTVTAVLTVEADLSYFPSTLDAVLSQSILPALVIVADSAVPKGFSPERYQLNVPLPQRADGQRLMQNVEIQHVGVRGAASFGDAVAKGIEAGSLRSSTEHLWLLHDDSRPGDSSVLEILLETDRNSPGARLVGAKQVDWDNRGLHDVGYYLTKNWHRASLVVDGEEDQDQYDDREDVYGVSLAGALISFQTWVNLAGTDSWYGTFGEGMDFARRVYRSGGRVVVAPSARIAHRRARFDGVRSKEGNILSTPSYRVAYTERITARQRFVSTSTVLWKKPFLWIWSILVAIATFFSRLFAKKPGEAVSEFFLPWQALIHTPSALAARSRLKALPSSEKSRFTALIATSAQLRDWKQRQEVFEAQQGGVVISPLARVHLHELAKKRALCVGLLAIVGVGAGLVMNWSILGGILAGGAVYSSLLAPTAASLGITAGAATTMWSFSSGLGAAAAPMPLNLVLVVLSVITLGHLSFGIALFIVLAPALMMFSFWALAGVMSRSLPLRFSAALLWGALPAILGIYQTANLAMLIVFVFLPLSFFLVFRAVGMYAVDAPRTPHSSVQAAALAGLAMSFVALSEPQLVLPFFLVFTVFFVLVRRHRSMLLLMPLPSIILLAPTFFSIVLHAKEGLWRQLFVDANQPDITLQASPSETDFVTSLNNAFLSMTDFSQPWQKIAFFVVLGGGALVGVAALISLFVPSSLRLSRMAWVSIAAGTLLCVVAPRIAVGIDGTDIVAASILPAFAFTSMGVLLAACSFTGKNDTHFSFDIARKSHSGKTVVGGVARGFLAIVLVLSVAMGAGIAASGWGSSSTLAVTGKNGLPIIATQDLEKSRTRILSLYSDTINRVDYSVMRTGAGDLVDANATTQISDMLAANPQENELRQVSARLLENNDDAAIATLARLGFTGIYVPNSSSTVRSNLVAHITASAGTEQVVNNSSGLYVRLTSGKDSSQSVDTSGEEASYKDPLRRTWVALVVIVLLVYIIVAIPRGRTVEEEK